MTVSVASFRINYPEFASVTDYPSSGLTYYLTLAGLLLNESRWFDLYDVGTELFMAHNSVIEFQNAKAAAVGGAPGVSSGPVASKGVDKVNVSYDTTAGLLTDAGHWNLTNYGTRFLDLARMVGTGGIQF